MQTFRKIIKLFTPKERKTASLLMLMILIMALLDLIGVASIMPFMAVLMNPSIIETNALINYIFLYSAMFGVETKDQFLFALGVLVFLLLVISLSFKAITIYTQLRFVSMREYSLSKRLMETYLQQPYSWFLDRHSADLGKSILSEVSNVIACGLKPMIDLMVHGTIVMALTILLIFIDPKLALIVSFTLGSAYGLIYFFVRGKLKELGSSRLEANQLRFTSISEAFGAVKEIKVGGLEQTYVQRFSDPAQNFAHSQALAQIISQIPRFAIEAIAFGGMMLLVLYFISQSGTFVSAIPVISLYVLAGYRLMPALQQIYNSIALLKFVRPALDEMYKEIENIEKIKPKENKNINTNLSFNKSIVMNKINFKYPNSKQSAIKNIELLIPSHSKVGFVGTTGSGKTTAVDIILGLLEAQEGTLEIDGNIINNENYRAWQNLIGYVPQNIYLADDTIAANIAFGVPNKLINHKAVENASKTANLHEFIVNELPLKYLTSVGERGVRLSGGQRQRIGIARALYHNPKVLILDEATSALDNETEKAVMEAIDNLDKEITIILIAHRLSTVKKCDKIFLLDKGELKAQGTFDELIRTSNNFRANATNL